MNAPATFDRIDRDHSSSARGLASHSKPLPTPPPETMVVGELLFSGMTDWKCVGRSKPTARAPRSRSSSVRTPPGDAPNRWPLDSIEPPLPRPSPSSSSSRPPLTSRVPPAPFPPPPPRKPTQDEDDVPERPRALARLRAPERPDRVHLRRVRGGARGGDRRGRPRVVVGPQRARPARPRRPGQPPGPDRDRGPPEGRQDRLRRARQSPYGPRRRIRQRLGLRREQARPTRPRLRALQPQEPEGGGRPPRPREVRGHLRRHVRRVRRRVHRVAVRDGHAFTCGLPQYGQLGHGTDHEYNMARAA